MSQVKIWQKWNYSFIWKDGRLNSPSQRWNCVELDVVSNGFLYKYNFLKQGWNISILGNSKTTFDEKIKEFGEFEHPTSITYVSYSFHIFHLEFFLVEATVSPPFLCFKQSTYHIGLVSLLPKRFSCLQLFLFLEYERLTFIIFPKHRNRNTDFNGKSSYWTEHLFVCAIKGLNNVNESIFYMEILPYIVRKPSSTYHINVV